MLSIDTCRRTLWTSTTGDSPVTVMVSCNAPTRISIGTVTVIDPVNSIPSRLNVLNPVNDAVSAYVPGRRSTIRYWPVLSVITERTFSMRVGLDASTVTPGNTAPDESLITPVIDAWANAATGADTNQTASINVLGVRTQHLPSASAWYPIPSRLPYVSSPQRASR